MIIKIIINDNNENNMKNSSRSVTVTPDNTQHTL